jgi:phosphoribosylanthranilate isomerase
MTRVKICGITNSDDALLACQFGADAIGLVFYPPSSRHVTIEQAKYIVQNLPPFMSTVALFVNAQRTEINQVIKQVGIDIIQFHGAEQADFCASFERPYIKAVRMKEGLDFHVLQNNFSSARGLLLDTYKKGVPGGTGETFDWHKVPNDLTLPIILAGGLNVDNVAQAIAQVKPYAVDVSGGVEAENGIKDPKKVAAFLQACQH